MLDTSADTTLVWVEVLSSFDLRQGDARLVGERRRRWLLDHGVSNIWAVTDVFGAIGLAVFHASGASEVFISPATITVRVVHTNGEDEFVIDLAKLEEAAAAAGVA
ncbi:MAG: hypothetical protein ABSE77_16955 [Acidimicrobiales bacterium]